LFFIRFVFLQTYFYNDDAFNFNYGQAKAQEGKWIEAEEVKKKLNPKKYDSILKYLRHFF
jgi:intraflagellar transport protein 56